MASLRSPSSGKSVLPHHNGAEKKLGPKKLTRKKTAKQGQPKTSNQPKTLNMHSSAQNTAKLSTEEILLFAALETASAADFTGFSLEKISEIAAIPLRETQKYFPTKSDIAPALIRLADAQMQVSSLRNIPSEKMEEQLFDLFMQRFDFLQNHRSAVLQTSATALRCPHTAAKCLAARWASAERLSQALDLKRTKFPRLSTAGLFALYQYCFIIWQKDTSPDLAKTMAALDRSLKFFIPELLGK